MIRSSLIDQGKRASLMSVLLAALLLAAWAPLAGFYSSRWHGLVLTLGWSAVTLNLLRATLGHVYRLNRLPFRSFDVALEDDRVRVGQSFKLVVRLEAKRPAVLVELAADLQCVNVGTTEEVLHRVRRVLAKELDLPPGASRSFEAVLEVPAGAPPSYKDTLDRIRWKLSLVCAVREWGELRDEIDVTVAPS